MFSITGDSVGVASSQPSRHPVIAQFFDSVWTNQDLVVGRHDVVERRRADRGEGQVGHRFRRDDHRLWRRAIASAAASSSCVATNPSDWRAN